MLSEIVLTNIFRLEFVSYLQTLANRRHSKFRSDPSLSSAVSATNDDYWDSGWSRGHMAPAGNNKHSQEAMNNTFLLSNIVPQVGKKYRVFLVYYPSKADTVNVIIGLKFTRLVLSPFSMWFLFLPFCTTGAHNIIYV